MEEPAPAQQRFMKKMEPDYLGFGYAMPPAPWLDIRVFYVRVSCCSLEDAPETLTIRYVPRPVASTFEVNGCRVPAADEAVLIVRRDRVDKESLEATYVGTDRLRTTGSLPFEVCHNKETLICGAVEKSDVWPDGQGLDRIGAVGTLTKSYKAGWLLECRCAISSPGCTFLKKRGDLINASLSPPLMEVYVAGRYSGAPVILTQTVELLIRRKLGRRNTLDAIPEADESERSSNNSTLDDLASQVVSKGEQLVQVCHPSPVQSHQQLEEREGHKGLDRPALLTDCVIDNKAGATANISRDGASSIKDSLISSTINPEASFLLVASTSNDGPSSVKESMLELSLPIQQDTETATDFDVIKSEMGGFSIIESPGEISEDSTSSSPFASSQSV